MKIVDIIKYEGNNNILIWKHPAEDFNTLSQLIVYESQEAILFKDGQALDSFGPGRHTLKTSNIPLLRSITSIPTDGETPFKCQVYFINKVDILDILWGTSTPMPIQDVKYGIILPVRANGQFGLRVEEGRKLLLKLVGTESELNKEKLKIYFKGFLMTKVKDYISKAMVRRQISFLEIYTYLDEISEGLREQIEKLYGDYGLKVVNFSVNSISIPEDDPSYIKIKNALASAKEKEVLAGGKKIEMDMLGYSYAQERTFDMLQDAAKNEGNSGNIMGVGMGMGMGVNLGNVVGDAMAGTMNNVSNRGGSIEEIIECPNCKTKLKSGAKFCFECGNKVEIQENITICPSCKERVPKGKFCLNCGCKLINKCPGCNAELPDGAKFCLECGEKVNG